MYVTIWVLLALLYGTSISAVKLSLPLQNIQLPPGFKIDLYSSDNLENAREMCLSKGNTGNKTIVYVSTREAKKVYALVDNNSNGTVDSVYTILSGLDSPHGIAWRNGSLFVAQVTRVLRFDNVDAQVLKGQILKDPTIISAGWPNFSDHSAKFIAFGPDGKLYSTLGSPSNVQICGPAQVNTSVLSYCSIVRMNPDGSELETFATGIRNTVGFDWHPTTSELYFTINGRDQMGDDRPDDTLCRASKPGAFYGFPFCHRLGLGDPYLRNPGPGLPLGDPTFAISGVSVSSQVAKDVYCQGNATPPVQALGPHVGALGMRFYTGSMFPAEYNGSMFIATHGSWNRNLKIGYQIYNLRLDANGSAAEYTSFAKGWLQGAGTAQQSVWGRPADVLPLPDGSLLVSDDSAGAVYRIRYAKPTDQAPGLAPTRAPAPGPGVQAATTPK